MKRRARRWQLVLAATLTAVALVVAACGGTKPPAATSPGAGAEEPSIPPAKADAVRVARDPTDIPAPITRTTPDTVVVELETVELDGQLADGTTYTYWTFSGTVPGPMIRVRAGDTVEIHLKNHANSTQIHSIDLHAVNGPGGGAAATQVEPGGHKAFRFKALNPGVYIYHCASPYVPAHIANGMYGIIVVEPEGGLAPVDKEFYVVQGEIYANLRPGQAGHAGYDAEAMFNEEPNYVVFNGQAQALTGEHALRAEVGDRVRIFIGNAGVNLISSFHVIGEVFDVVHPEGASEAQTNVQTTLIPAGGAAWVEFTVDVPGNYVLVDHALNRVFGKGALAVLEVTGPENPAIYEAID